MRKWVQVFEMFDSAVLHFFLSLKVWIRGLRQYLREANQMSDTNKNPFCFVWCINRVPGENIGEKGEENDVSHLDARSDEDSL